MEVLAFKVTILPYAAFHSAVAAGAMATHTPMTDILMINDVAECRKVTERTIYRLATAKKIPAFMVGGSWRFSRKDIDDWIHEQSAIYRPELAGRCDLQKDAVSKRYAYIRLHRYR